MVFSESLASGWPWGDPAFDVAVGTVIILATLVGRFVYLMFTDPKARPYDWEVDGLGGDGDEDAGARS